MSAAADAFAAREHIDAGDWDAYLSALGDAIRNRAVYLAEIRAKAKPEDPFPDKSTAGIRAYIEGDDELRRKFSGEE